MVEERKEKHGTRHISEEKLDVCWRQAGKHTGGSVKGTALGMLGDRVLTCWLLSKGSFATSRPGFCMVQESSLCLERC